MFLPIALVVLSIFSMYLGVVVLVRDSKELVNRLFFLLAIVASIWTVASYFGGHISYRAISDVFVRVDYSFGLGMTWLFMLFGIALNNNTKLLRQGLRKTIILSMPIAVVSSIASASPALLVNNESGLTQTDTAVVLYTLLQAIFIGIGLWYLIRAYKRAEGLERNRRGAIILGLVISSLLMGVPYLIAGHFISSKETLRTLQEAGSLGLVAFLLASGYSIIRHHLFDIRAAIARTSAYIFSIGLMIVTYVMMASLLTSLVVTDADKLLTQRIVFIVFIVIIALIFQPIKVFFDRVSDKIFYRTVYDPQKLLDEMGDLLVGSLDVQQIVSGGVHIIERSVRPSHTVFAIRDAEGRVDLFGTTLSRQQKENINGLIDLAQEQKEWPIIAEEQDYGSFKRLLDKTKTFFIHEIVAKDEKVGYLILGEKKNGSIYNQQDRTFLSILSDELAIAVQNARRYQEIEGFNEKLIQEIEHATKELRSTNNKLKALDQAKDEFISMASHQLRTPLTSIKGYLSMVLEGDAGDVAPQQKEMLETAFTSAQRMVYLISDLLNVSRLQTGKFVIEPVESYLPDVVEQEISQLKEAITAKKIKLEYKKPKDFPKVKLDETKIRQVIMNFTDNALYYTPVGGKVVIELSSTAKSVQFTVMDTGIGVPKAEQSKLFTKFYRADNARKARPDGTGLGLFMAKKVIVASGGSLIFRSKENSGSTFGFIFPIK